MTDDNASARAAFLADQQAGKAEAASRDQADWMNHLYDVEATIQMKREAARNEGAKATLRNTISFLIGTLTFALILVGISLGIQAIAGLFR